MSNNEINTTKKTIILVHGAFADGSGWQRVIPLLQAQGLNVIAVQHPMDSLASDVATVQRTIAATEGEIILVGHSYGGAIITQGGTSHKVSALVYVAAFAPSAGETVNETQAGYPKAGWVDSLAIDQGGFAKLLPNAFAEFFAQDLPVSESSVMAAAQGASALGCFDTKLTENAWSSKPTWYIVATGDRMINPDLERKFAEKMGAKTTVIESSHVPMLSKPEEVAAVILEAAGFSEEKQSKGQGRG